MAAYKVIVGLNHNLEKPLAYLTTMCYNTKIILSDMRPSEWSKYSYRAYTVLRHPTTTNTDKWKSLA